MPMRKRMKERRMSMRAKRKGHMTAAMKRRRREGGRMMTKRTRRTRRKMRKMRKVMRTMRGTMRHMQRLTSARPTRTMSWRYDQSCGTAIEHTNTYPHADSNF
jgi:hypothetical protein